MAPGTASSPKKIARTTNTPNPKKMSKTNTGAGATVIQTEIPPTRFVQFIGTQHRFVVIPAPLLSA
jgi:hypothetical protein